MNNDKKRSFDERSIANGPAMIFHSGDENAFHVNENGIDVEFNPGEMTAFQAMLTDLMHTIQVIGYPCQHFVTDFLNDFTRDNSLWNKDGKWIGKYARSFKL